MNVPVTVVPYGRPASEALAAAIATAKAGRALDPVTVIVPSNFAGLAARRLLGSGQLGAQGIANVSFVTPFRLAELVAADLLLDRRPLTNPVLGAAIRLALAEDPGPFARVRDHHATEAALADVYTELSTLDADAIERIADEGGRAGATAVRFHRSIGARLQDFHDEADLVRAAADRADLDRVLAPFGHLVWFLPTPLNRPLARFVGAALATAPGASAIVGTTFDTEADAGTWATCEAAGLDRAAATPAVDPVAGPSRPPTASAIVSVTDADEEVRAVVRRIAALVEGSDGPPIPLDRIGVFHPTPDPYVRILEQQFAAAGIPANGPSRRRLADSVAGRVLLGALRLPRERWRRDRVMALVSTAPLRAGTGRAHPVSWEELSRRAGVVQDLGDWTVKLDAHRARLRAQLEAQLAEPREDGDGDGAIGERITFDLAEVDALASFVRELAAHVEAVERAKGWEAKATAARALLHHLVGAQRSSWPEPEQAAADQVEDALVRLGALSALEPSPSTDVFLRALATELDVTLGRNGRFGDGVMYGPLASAVGLDFDAVFVLGCAEGLCPAPRRDDAMLPDQVRELAGGALPLRAERLADQHRLFLAALASAPPGRRTLTVPRGSLRANRGPLPSRWLLDSATALAGKPVYATDFIEHPECFATVVASHAEGLLDARVPASDLEWDIAALARHLAAGGRPDTHAVGRLVARGLEAQVARRSDAFTEWDGNLAGEAIPPTSERPLSPTRLQTWAECGFKYFLAHTLGLRDRDDPERIIQLSPLERGSAIHQVLEEFLDTADALPDPDVRWSEADHARLRAIAERHLDELEAKGLTGRSVLWRTHREDLLDLLDGFLHADDEHRRTTRSRPAHLEMRFGFDEGPPPVRITLPDGRELAFRGAFDRADRGDDGRWHVSDYKTGRVADYRGLSEGDPTGEGRRLQLGLYAEAATQLLDAEAVDAHYWVIDTRTGASERHGYAWTPERRQRYVEVLTAIVDGIEGGTYPMVPGEYSSFWNTHHNCRYCPFDVVCPSARGEQAAVKADAPELRIRDGLVWEEAS